MPIPLLEHIKEHDKRLLGDIVGIANSWTAAHRAYPRSSQRTPYTADSKSSGRPPSQGSNKSTGQSDGNKTSDSLASRIAMRDGSEYKFAVDDDLLYCRRTKSNSSRQLGNQALLVPAQCRKAVLSIP